MTADVYNYMEADSVHCASAPQIQLHGGAIYCSLPYISGRSHCHVLLVTLIPSPNRKHPQTMPHGLVGNFHILWDHRMARTYERDESNWHILAPFTIIKNYY